MNTEKFAGFWRRFVAFVIDFLILWVIVKILSYPLSHWFGIQINSFNIDKIKDILFSYPSHHTQKAGFDAKTGNFTINFIFSVVLQWLYFSTLESSNKQATIGKMVMNIEVTGLEGGRISFLRATLRFFSKYLSYLILFGGFIMVGFTNKKQGLHDFISHCLVIRKK